MWLSIKCVKGITISECNKMNYNKAGHACTNLYKSNIHLWLKKNNQYMSIHHVEGGFNRWDTHSTHVPGTYKLIVTQYSICYLWINAVYVTCDIWGYVTRSACTYWSGDGRVTWPGSHTADMCPGYRESGVLVGTVLQTSLSWPETCLEIQTLCDRHILSVNGIVLSLIKFCISAHMFCWLPN